MPIYNPVQVLAVGVITSAGVLSGGRGIASINKPSAGVYDITLNFVADTSRHTVLAQVRASGVVSACRAYFTSTTTIRVELNNTTTSAVLDADFSLSVLA